MTMARSKSFLRTALRGNAAFSALSGVVLLFAAQPLAQRLGYGSVWTMGGLGVVLLLFAWALFRNAARPTLHRGAALAMAVLDVLWVVGSAGLLWGRPELGTAAGKWAVSLVAGLVAFFAVLQLYGLARERGAPALVQASAWRRLGRGAALLVVILLTIAALPIFLGFSSLADVRPPQLKRQPITPAAERQGRELLQQAADRHGLAAWRGHRTMEVVAVDEWPLKAFGHFPEGKQRFRSASRLGTFTSRLELLDGQARGEVWGMESWAAYKQRPGEARPRFRRDSHVEFYLPTLQYFNELPFRLLGATFVAYAGEVRHRGRLYDQVFVTWGSPQPHAEADQYVLWIDRETRLIRIAAYTVRDGFPAASGSIFFDDFRPVDGVMVPFVQSVTVGTPEEAKYPLEKNFFHRLTIADAKFDASDEASLYPDPGRPEIGDSKPPRG